jgi:hypothetical protein
VEEIAVGFSPDQVHINLTHSKFITVGSPATVKGTSAAICRPIISGISNPLT